ncbi:hypothetical protein ES703_120985 [subsurface metagenome]
MTEPETIEYKGRVIGKVGGCTLIVSTDAAGKKHFEATCLNKEAREELAALFEEEAILRITPKAFLEKITEPVPEPVVEPVTEPKPDTRLNPTES